MSSDPTTPTDDQLDAEMDATSLRSSREGLNQIRLVLFPDEPYVSWGLLIAEVKRLKGIDDAT